MTGCQGTVMGEGGQWHYERVAQGSCFVEVELFCILIVVVVIQTCTLDQIA